FAVRARREGVMGYTSQELAAEAGSRIMERIPNLKVDLTNPEYELFMEARQEGGMIYDIRIPGPGGLPYGTQGIAVSLLSAGIDSPVAAWLMMRRGVRMIFLHIDPGRYGGCDIRANLIRNLSVLSLWVPGYELVLAVIPAEEMYQRLMSLSEPRFRCVICKRVMLELAAQYAEKMNGDGMVTGDNLGQVATQTLHNLSPISRGIQLPVYRPLIGYDKEEIITLARKIGSFNQEPGDTSCHVLPPKPATRSDADRIEELIKQSDIRSMYEGMLSGSRKELIKNGRVSS
ncbi:MAG: THUMP domain-containing protein, partial [Methanospirillum sp.]|nr:THUMP domain-containing protein [Methanospirillum sp.]